MQVGRVVSATMHLEGKVLAVTGVGGFIGAALAASAKARGMRVRGLDQSPAASRRPELAGVDVVVGDICDPAAAAAVCAGADVVVHTAAVVKEHGPRELFQRVNVDGSRIVAGAAKAAGVRRLVHFSSVMVYGFTYPDGVEEDGPLRGEGNAYCETKIEGELAARAFHDAGRFDVTVIRPGDVYGAGSVPWVVRPFDLLRAGLFVVPSGGRGLINHVYVDNLLEAVFAAVERDANGVFTVTDGVGTPCVDYFAPIARAAGRKGIRTAPAAILRPLFAGIEAASALLGREPPARRSAVDYLMRPYPYSIVKARRELGYEPGVDLAEGMRRVSEWLAARSPAAQGASS
jgi:nucleoside-diphosphate-sugar epimerase